MIKKQGRQFVGHKLRRVLLAVAVIVLLSLFAWFVVLMVNVNSRSGTTINSFADCQDKYGAEFSNPPTCATPEGRIYTGPTSKN